MVGLIQKLTAWCSDNNLILNYSKTKELVIYFEGKGKSMSVFILYQRRIVEKVSDFKFLGTYICQDLTWSANTNALVKKTQHRLYCLRSLRRVNFKIKIQDCYSLHTQLYRI